MATEEEVVEFFSSMRGRYIIGQALQLAIEVLESVPEPMTEVSNISDMKFLRDNLFSMGAALTVAKREGLRVNGL